MPEDRDQLVEEQAMDRMAVAPPDPKKGTDADRQMQAEAAPDRTSGVDDQDPLSAHPT